MFISIVIIIGHEIFFRLNELISRLLILAIISMALPHNKPCRNKGHARTARASTAPNTASASAASDQEESPAWLC